MLTKLINKTIGLTISRLFIFALLIFLIDLRVNLEASLMQLAIYLAGGILVALSLTRSKLSVSGNYLLIIGSIILIKLGSFFSQYLSSVSNPFIYYADILLHAIPILVFYISLISTYSYLNFRRYRSFETAGLLLFFVLLFAPHRNYRLDLIRLVNDLAWEYSQPPLAIIIGFGLLATIFLGLYLYLNNLFNGLNDEKSLAFKKIKSSNRAIFTNLVFVAVLLIATSYFAHQLYKYHQVNSKTALQNGVGSTSETGQSPLDFKSALGSSNQPTALVRLSNDYSENPHLPMLYLRETALSKYKNFKFHLAKPEYDQDITRRRPSDTYINKKRFNYADRKEVEQKIYLIGSHNVSFSIDYPTEHKPIRLSPHQTKFIQAYQAKSLASTFNLDELRAAKIGNSDWSEGEWKHYLENNTDTRYLEFALKVTADYPSAYEKAMAVVQYFDQHAIYTLSPNHEVAEDEDPTAAFLFGDLRGYCVHFAHALVYIYRSLGIPARIGTGYLSDFSQSKDGHVLLRSSDRHAWSEIYFENYGWIPFDPQPVQVESHADSPIDQNLLDELIDSLGSEESQLDEDLLSNEISEDSEKNYFYDYLKVKHILIILGIVLTILYLRKYYQIFSWRLNLSNKWMNKRFYYFLALLVDEIQSQDLYGYTKQEIFKLIQKRFALLDSEYINHLNSLAYRNNYNEEFSKQELRLLYQDIYKHLNFKDKLKLFLLP